MKCPNCGADSDNRFCPYCGTEMPSRVAEESGANTNVSMMVTDSSQHVTNIYYGVESNASMLPQYDFSEYQPKLSPKNQNTTLILCIFLGVFGAHYFYVGRVGKGILYLLTCGFVGIGWLVDIIKILRGIFIDENGLPICSSAKAKRRAAESIRHSQYSGKTGRFFEGMFRFIFGLLFILFALVFFIGFQSEGMTDPVSTNLFLAILFLIVWIVLSGRGK